MTIFRWCRKNVKNLVTSRKKKDRIDATYNEILVVLKIGHVSLERNETSHHRLLDREEEDLENIRVFMNALTQNVSGLKELVS